MDLQTKAILTKKINAVASGVNSVDVDNTTLKFDFKDGQQAEMTFPTPADGVSVTDVDVDENNVITVTFSDGTTQEAGTITTLKGDKGNDGKDGVDGRSITNIEVNEDKELITTMSDNTIINAGIIPTVKGDTGDTGQTGATGAVGSKGETGADGKSAYDVAVDNGYTGTQAEWLASLKGTASMSGDASSISDAVLKGSIIPDIGGAYSIGSEDKKLKAIYANEVYMSSNTLYINDTPVFHTDNTNDLMFTADNNQSIKVKTTGDATTNILSDQDVEIRTSKEASNINICAGDVSTGTSSNANVTASNNISAIANNQITNKAPNVVLDGAVAVRGGLTVDDLSVSGNLTVAGDSLKVDADNLTVKDNVIVINDGETGAGVTAGQAGLRIDRGDYADYGIIFDETDDMFKIGQIGNLQTIATHDYIDTALEGYTGGGSGDVDLSNYVTTTNLTTTLVDYTKSSDLTTKLGNYVTTNALSDTYLTNYAKTTDLHSHSNKSVLDKLSVSNSKLYYNGSAVSDYSSVVTDIENASTNNVTTLYSGTKSWTVSALSTTVASTITLSSAISNYDYIEFVFGLGNGTESCYTKPSTICKVSNIVYNNSTTSKPDFSSITPAIGDYISTGENTSFRPLMWFKNSTSLYISTILAINYSGRNVIYLKQINGIKTSDINVTVESLHDNATTLDSLTSSTSNGLMYDGESLSYPVNYSTAEKQIGTWIDGSTLYQRTWKYTLSDPSASTSVGTIPVSVNKMVKSEMFMVSSNSFATQIPLAQDGNLHSYAFIYASSTSSTLNYNSNNSTAANGATIYVTVQYIK